MCIRFALFICIFPSFCSTLVTEILKVESSNFLELHFLGNANDSRLLYFTFKSHYDSVVSTGATLSSVSTSTHKIATPPPPTSAPNPHTSQNFKINTGYSYCL